MIGKTICSWFKRQCKFSHGCSVRQKMLQFKLWFGRNKKRAASCRKLSLGSRSSKYTKYSWSETFDPLSDPFKTSFYTFGRMEFRYVLTSDRYVGKVLSNKLILISETFNCWRKFENLIHTWRIKKGSFSNHEIRTW